MRVRGHRVARRMRGVTLLEIAVVLVVIALFVEMGIQMQRSAASSKVITSQQGQLAQAHDLIVQFVRLNVRLPCPDVKGGGVESVQADGQHCLSGSGWLPYLSIGLKMPGPQVSDATIRYGVYAPATNLSVGLGGADKRGQMANFLASLTLAMQMSVTTAYAYVPSGQGCGSPELNPAFVLSLGGSAPDPANLCFSAGQGSQSVQVNVESLAELQTEVVDFERQLNPL